MRFVERLCENQDPQLSKVCIHALKEMVYRIKWRFWLGNRNAESKQSIARALDLMVQRGRYVIRLAATIAAKPLVGFCGDSKDQSAIGRWRWICLRTIGLRLTHEAWL